MAEFLNDKFRRIGVNCICPGRHDAHFHQALNVRNAPLRHAAGQILNGDGFRKNDLMDNFTEFRLRFFLPLALACPFD